MHYSLHKFKFFRALRIIVISELTLKRLLLHSLPQRIEVVIVVANSKQLIKDLKVVIKHTAPLIGGQLRRVVQLVSSDLLNKLRANGTAIQKSKHQIQVCRQKVDVFSDHGKVEVFELFANLLQKLFKRVRHLLRKHQLLKLFQIDLIVNNLDIFGFPKNLFQLERVNNQACLMKHGNQFVQVERPRLILVKFCEQLVKLEQLLLLCVRGNVGFAGGIFLLKVIDHFLKAHWIELALNFALHVNIFVSASDSLRPCQRHFII